ncbi:salivary endonuclease isoform X1 [Megalopta genalis]|uniref:salivary endonuclease isoform X1 n=2 Tax=Megalopta genalis TaxID=115081 RepID=UPI003FD5E86C
MFHLVSLVVTLCLTVTILADCDVSIAYNYYGDLKDPQPLILAENGDGFFYPNRGRMLMLQSGQSVLIACPGDKNKIVGTNVKEATATCQNGKNFDVNGVTRQFSTITCESNPQISTRILTQKCLGDKISIAVGYQLTNKFLTTYEVCRNDNTYETYYSKFKLTKANQGQSRYPRPTWRAENHFNGMDVDRLYYWETQRTVIQNLLGSNAPAAKRVNKQLFLSRGHLTAKADFVYGSQQNCTFQYLNAAPQWSTFNSKNWEVLESSVRNFTQAKSLDLEVYTGVHGAMTMADIHGNQRVITITYRHSKPLLVPKFFWKIIYHRPSRKGTAFVGLNDPFITNATPDLYLCTNRIDSHITWLSWLSNYTQGLSYACTVDDLRLQIPTIPPLKVVDILI